MDRSTDGALATERLEEAEVWKAVIDRYGGRVGAYLRRQLRRQGIKDGNVIEAVLADVWGSLHQAMCEGAYDPEHGPVLNYLLSIARKLVGRMVRKREADQRHERMVSRPEAYDGAGDEGPQMARLGEFLTELPPDLREHCQRHLLHALPPADSDQPSDAAIWQRNHRVLLRLQRFLGITSEKS
jgi:hypothetical protein